MKSSIQFIHISKRYRIGQGTPNLRDLFSISKNRQTKRYHWAVKDVSFELYPGESLGIIGPNGAGKTTILKLLSQVTKPTSGEIQIQGRFSALIELGAGFHPDLTGRDNIFLNGTILGLTRSEIKKRFDEIIEFAGIGAYLDTPVKRYSSGMYARLGFAIAAHIDPEIMLIDEVLAVGDYAFRMKCYNRMDELRSKGTSLIFVSHNMEDVRRVCDRGIVMFKGEKAFEGTVDEAVSEYTNVLRRKASKSEKIDQPGFEGLSQRRMTHAAKIERVELVGEDGIVRGTVKSGETVYLVVVVQFYENAESPVFAITIHGTNGDLVYDTTTRVLEIETPDFKAGERVEVRYKLDINLLDGIYHLATDLAYADLSCYYDFIAEALNLVVVNGNKAKGVANLNAEVEFNPLNSVSSPTHSYEKSSYK
jgi:lipopolysaccharide transport system ATP-binding protein